MDVKEKGGFTDESTDESKEVLLGITPSKQSEEMQQIYKMISEQSRDIILLVRCKDGRILEANDNAVKAYGYSREELLCLDINDLHAPNTRLPVDLYIENADEKELLFETNHIRKDGSTLPVEVNSKRTTIGHEQVLLIITRDIIGRKKMEEQLRNLANLDPLTNIPNRNCLTVRLKQAKEKAKRGVKYALLIVDLDNFKMVNDTLDHNAGNEMLIILCQMLKNNLREEDFLARLGEDEFAILLEDVTIERARGIAEKLRQAVDSQEICLVKYKASFSMTISIGAAMLKEDLGSLKLLSQADLALNQAKESGRNRVVFAEGGNETSVKLTETNHLISLLKNALKDNLFKIYFQPIMNVSGCSVIYYEALIRLKDESGEYIPPVRFIPMAERYGLMPQIDLWVLKSVLLTMRKYPDIYVFINLSGASLVDENIQVSIENCIIESGIDPSKIGFEITETTLPKDMLMVEHWISRIKNLGCCFALDDFGSGFSSFSYLQHLPVDFLKIDGSFIRNLDRELANQAIVKAMNVVSHTLGKKTIAEFVENESILRTLREIGIDYGQGYYLGRPSHIFS